MAFTRRFLKGMGLTDEQVDTVIEAHTETVDALKEQRDSYKEAAEKLPALQKELDEAKKNANDGYKEKYEKEHADFEKYKSGVTAKEAQAAKESAARAYFKSKGIPDSAMAMAVRGAKAEIEALELDGSNIKDAKGLDELLGGDYKALIGSRDTSGTSTPNPAGNSGGTRTKAEIYAKDDKGRYKLSTAERQEALAQIMSSEQNE